MAQIDPATDALVGEWLSLPEVAGLLGIPVGRVKQLLRDRKLLAVTRPEGTLAVPAAFLDGNQVVKGLCGTLTLLFDCGFGELEALRWLFTADESLPGTPIDAIVERRATAVPMYASSLIETVRCHLLRMPVRNGDNDLYHDRTAGEGMGRARERTRVHGGS